MHTNTSLQSPYSNAYGFTLQLAQASIPYITQISTLVIKDLISKGTWWTQTTSRMESSLSFSPLHPELSLGSRIIDNFSDRFSFNLATRNKNYKNLLPTT